MDFGVMARVDGEGFVEEEVFDFGGDVVLFR